MKNTSVHTEKRVGNKEHRNPLEDKLTNLEYTPSEGVWNAINDQLDADISRTTRRTRKFLTGSIFFIMSLTVITLSFPVKKEMVAYDQIGITQNLKRSQQDIEYKSIIQSRLEEKSIEAPSFSLATSPLPEAQTESDLFAMIESVESHKDLPLELKPIPVRTVEMTSGSNDYAQTVRLSPTRLDESTDPSVILADRSASDVSYKETSQYYDLAGIQEISSVSGFYLGASGSWHATTLLSNRPIIGLYEDGVNHFRILPAKSITMGYLVNDHLAIQAEYVYNAVEGTAISTSADAQDRVFNVSLYMDQFPVYLKFRKPTTLPVLNKHASLNLLAGLQFNRLRDYRLPQERRYEIVEEEVFRTNSLSLSGGAEIEAFILPNWMLSIGLDASLSQNLSPFGDPLSVYPKHSLTAGVRGGIYYFLGSGR